MLYTMFNLLHVDGLSIGHKNELEKKTKKYRKMIASQNPNPFVYHASALPLHYAYQPYCVMFGTFVHTCTYGLYKANSYMWRLKKHDASNALSSVKHKTVYMYTVMYKLLVSFSVEYM